ncbi:FtsX-like permease family protein [Paenibacillus sp. LMG 31456]|uniref:FtsX-like permease family protein n=1 Tax=Paenibacillus foliorum TaxID=2654974 RepID=A0A972K0X4_9BACL|nr:ABC transporter permease [Paenibacillus foliorum]NOU95121.1 FtsX-like permease family protein [Paenibacillus foliorum]
MRPLRALIISMRGLWSYPTRTWLAVLGIMISTLLIVFLLSVLYNFKTSLVGQVESMGVQQIIAAPGRILNSESSISQANLSSLLSYASVTSTLTYKDAMDVKDKLPEIIAAAPQIETVTHVAESSKTIESMYTGTTPDYLDMFSLQLEEGRFFTEEETNKEAPVLILGQAVKQLLFEGRSALGQKVKIKGIEFEIIGVLKEKQLIGFNFDERVYTGYPMVSNSANLKNASMIFFKFQSNEPLDIVRDKIAKVMIPNHGGIRDFGLLAPDGAINMINTIADLVTAIAVGITGVSFLVGGIGIMNVMLLTVKERTREIGIRKAVGARWWDILLQFLMEATYISVLGCVLGLAGSYGLLRLLHSFFPVLSAQFPLEMILWCLLFSVVLGVLFGISPAIKALRIKPIDALRYE